MATSREGAQLFRRILALSATAVVSFAVLPVQPVAAAAWTPYPQTTTADQAMTYQINPSHSGSPGPQTLVPPLKPAWTVDLGGPVSYPLLGAYVFVTATNLTTNRPQLYAINYHTGTVAWGPIDLGGTYWANASYDNGRVFTINSTGQMQGFDEQTGAVQWTTQLPGQSSFTSPPAGSIFGSNSDLVYTSGAGSGGTLYAVHEGSGAIAWQASVMNGDHSTPVVTNAGVYVSYACAQTYDFDPLTGALLWHHATNCEGGGGKTAVLNNGKLYVRDAILGNTVLDASTGASLGTFGATVAPAFSGTTGFFLDGTTLRGVDLNTNSALWSFTGDGALSTAPIVINGTVYIGSTSGTLFGVDATTGTSSWSASLGAPIKAPDEQNASAPLAGLSAGGGYLAAPAGNTLTLFGSALQVVPGSVNFGVKTLGSSTSTPVWVGNNFAAGLTITSVAASGDYAASSSCSLPVNPGQACQITVTFTPSALGPRNGTLTIADSAPGSPHLVPLIGGATDGVIDHLSLTPPGATVAAGSTQAYGAEAYDAFGQDAGDFTNRVTFAVNQVGCTANACNVGTKAGSQQVTALFTGQAKAIGGTTILNVLAGPLDHITLAPATANAVAGAAQAYTVEAFDQYGNDLGSATAATTFSIGPDGSCAAAACSANLVGPHTITAADSGKTAAGTLNVTAAPVDHITISPTSSTVAAGGSQAYTTEAFDQYGNDLGSATSASAFSITPNGSCTAATCTATGAGTHTVTATESGKSATATLTVSAGSLDHITISSPDNTWTAGAGQTYTTEALDVYGNDLGSATAASTFTIRPSGSCTLATCTATAAGPYTVTATDNGKSASWELMVRSAGPDHIVISPNVLTARAGDQTYLNAYVADQYGNGIPYVIGFLTTITPDGSCTSSAMCIATVPGPHSVTLMSAGLTATATINVTAGPAATLTFSPASSTVTAGGTATYTVTAADQYGNGLGDVTASTIFSIAPDGSCTRATCGSTTSGAHTVTASMYGGPSGTTSLTVTAGALDHIGLAPAAATITAGAAEPYTTEAYDQYGNDLGPAASATLTIAPDGTCGAGSCSATHSGTHTVTGTASGKIATGTLSVNPGPIAGIALYGAGTTPAGYAQLYSLISFDQYGNGIGQASGFSLTIGSPATACAGATCTETVVGTYVVTATYQGFTATGKQTVVAGPLDHLVVTPTTATIVAGGNQAYAAEGFDAYGNDRGSLTTSSSFGIAPDGSCTGASCASTKAGAHTVTASMNGGPSGTATLAVTAGALDHIGLAPAAATITAGAAQPYTTDAYDLYGNDLGAAASATLTITPDGSCGAGSCSATHSGLHSVTATASGKTATGTLSVNPGPMAGISLYGAATTPAGYAQPYSLVALDQYGNGIGNVLSGFSLTIGPPTTNCAGTTCSETAVGNYVVTATYQGLTATGKQTVIPGALDHLVLTPATATIVAGGSQAYAVEGLDAYGNDRGSLTTSSSFGIAPDGSCNGATCTATKAGSHTVTAAYQGKTVTSSLVVNAGPVSALAVSPASLTLTVGQSAALTASATDAYGNAVGAGTVTWAMSSGTPGKITSTTGKTTTFTASANTAGTGTIVAHLGALTAQSAARVLPAAPKALTATVDGHQVSLRWSAAAGDRTYAVYRKTGSGAWVLIKTGLTGTSFNDSGLIAGTAYKYYVTGWAVGLESVASNTVSIIGK